VIEWLLQRARTYVYSTALPPMAAAVAIRAMDLVDSDYTLLGALRDRIDELRAHCARRDIALLPSESAIHPIVLGAPARALEAARKLAARGFLVPAIRPPSVPPGTSRLRISLTAAHTVADIEALADALAECLRA
jgi:8-amino-7-oxononanoate synthase